MTPMESVARELGLLIRNLKGLHTAAVTAAGLRVELPALTVLHALDAAPAQRPSALAEQLQLDLSSISRQVAALEREGWVSRSRDPGDSRAALLDLTADGRDVLDRVRRHRVAELSALLPAWSADELAAFAAQLHRFRTDLAGAQNAKTTTTATAPSSTAPTRTPALAGQETT